jgi:hypothetical protein
MKSVLGCLGKAELDLHTLIWTRGAAFPLSSLESRLKCPLCGSRRVAVIFDVPTSPPQCRSQECRAVSQCAREAVESSECGFGQPTQDGWHTFTRC